jgi:GntR family transcriptional regulator
MDICWSTSRLVFIQKVWYNWRWEIRNWIIEKMDEIQKGTADETVGMQDDMRRRLQSSAQPFYVSLSNQLRGEIIEGRWPPRAQLPTIDQLSERYGVARVTVRQALGTLASEGLIERIQGKGTFVADKLKKPKIVQLESSWQSLLQMLEGNVPKLLESTPVCDLPPQSPKAGVAADGSYRHMRRVHYTENEPYCVLDVFLANSCYRRAPREFDTKMIIPVLQRVARRSLGKMTQSFRILTADLTLARLLDVPLNAPIGEVQRVITNRDNEILYLGTGRYRGDLVVFNTAIEVRSSA